MGDLIGWLILLALLLLGIVIRGKAKEQDCPFCQGKGYVGQECHVCDGKRKL